MKSFANLMVVKGEDLAFSGDRHPGTLQIGLNIAQEECIGSVFMGIKAIIQSKVDEIHARFQDNFSTLEQEVRKRDEIIFRLQRRIQELERLSDRRRPRNGNGGGRSADGHPDFGGHEGDNEMDDMDGEMDDDEELLLGPDSSFQSRYPMEFQTSYLFSRGDSIDTVISAQDYEDEVFERSELDSREASRSLSQPVGEPRSSHHQHQRRSRDMGNGDGQKHPSATWTQISEEETIEMREFGTSPWQVEFHRDRDSLPPPNEKSFGTRSIDKDSVAVDIGNTSTEYESSASSGSEEKKPKGVLHEIVHRRMKEEPVALDDDDDEEGEQSDDGSEEEESSDSSTDEPQLTNKNWEVALLAKEMDKIEKTRPDNSEMFGEAQHLQNEIKEMRDAVASGELSTTELDMLESIVERKSKRVKALAKALSVEAPLPPATLLSRSSSSTAAARNLSRGKNLLNPHQKAQTKVMLMIYAVFHAIFSCIARTMGGSNQLQGLSPIESPTTSNQPHLGLGSPTSPPHSVQPSTSLAGSERLSPGERRELHKLIFSRKRSTTVRRQSSLCETSVAKTAASAAARESQRRRESTGAFPVSVGPHESSTKSFFSKLSLVRQFTSRGYKPPAGEPGPSSSSSSLPSTDQPTAANLCASGVASTGSATGESKGKATICTSGTTPTVLTGAGSFGSGPSSGQAGESGATQSQHKSSSIVVLPNTSSTTTSVLSSSVVSDPATVQSEGHTGTMRSTTVVASPAQAPTSTTTITSESVLFTIPSTSGPAPVQPCSSKSVTPGASSSELGGESQPLLKK